MARRTRAVVTVADSERSLELAADVAASLDVEAGEAVRVLDGVGGSTVRRAGTDDALEAGTVRLAPGIADDLGVESGATALLEPTSPVPAETVEVAPVPGLSLSGGEGAVREAVGRRPLAPEDELEVSFLDGTLSVPLRVTETRPDGLVVVDETTTVELTDGPAPTAARRRVEPVGPDAVGGYESTIEELDAAVVAPLTDDERFAALGGTGRAGVLLVGPGGVGKTHLLGHAVWRANATVHSVDARALPPGDPDAVDERLRAAGAAVSGYGPGVVHLDGLNDFLADAADSAGAARLREWLRGVADEPGVVVVGEARTADDVPASFLRGDLLARTVRVGRPTDDDRAAILAVATRDTPVDASVDVGSVGRRAFGYVAADLLALRSRAVEAAADRAADGRPTVTAADFETALSATGPRELEGTRRQVPTTAFEDVGGLDAAKRELRRAVEWPLRYPEAFESVGIEPTGGVLLYGPPGTGKTMLARAVASTTDANFVSVSGPELMNKYVGESERAVRTVFEQARASAPTVIFFDEVDGLGSARSTDDDGSAPERVVSQLLTEMDGIGGPDGVTVVGATNRPDRLDDALLRPGRFDRLVEVPIPDETGRAEIFRVHTRDRPVEDLDYGALAARTEGYTGSDIEAVVREAGLFAIEEDIEDPAAGGEDDLVVRRRHFERALEAVEPSVSADERAYYESLDDRLGHSKDRSS
jgi:transitional endoplasmic reticulum ATPase